MIYYFSLFRTFVPKKVSRRKCHVFLTERSSLFGRAIYERKCKLEAKRSKGVTSQRNSRFVYSTCFRLDFFNSSLSLSFSLFVVFILVLFFFVAARENKRVILNSKKSSFKHSTRDKCNRPFSCKWGVRRKKCEKNSKWTVKDNRVSNYFHSNRRWFLYVRIVLNFHCQRDEIFNFLFEREILNCWVSNN